MKKTIAITLFVFTCFSLSVSTAIAYDNIGDTKEKAALIDTSLQRDIDALRIEVNDLAKRVEATEPLGTRDERRKQYFALDMEIDKLDDKIDLLEDRVKADYIARILTWEEYRSIERELETFEERLDRADDILEKIFGIND